MISGNWAAKAQQLTEEMVEKMDGESFSSKPPVILMLAGFQGSGKTTVLEALKKKVPLPVLSADEIRQQLFDQGFLLSDEFRRMVEAVMIGVVTRVIEAGGSLAIDTNVTAVRREQILKALIRAKKNNYRLIWVQLTAPAAVLEQRVQERLSVKSRYNGTVEELRYSLQNQPMVGDGEFDAVYDTSRLSVEVIAGKIAGIIQGNRP